MTHGGLSGRQWRVWAAVACATLAAVAAGLAPLPEVLGDASVGGRSFAVLLSAAIVALAFLPFIVRGPARPFVCIAVATAALALGMASYSMSGYAQRACTARYAGKPIVIGTQLTDLGSKYKRDNPELSNDELLFDAAGAPQRLWTTESISRCRALISSTYFLWIPFLVVCLLATAQAIPRTVLSPVRGARARPPAATPSPTRYDAFISYRHDGVDKRFAFDLVDALEADGYAVAIDERDFPANASFLQEMERSVRESRFTLAVVSPRYLDSDACQEEAIICKVLDMGDRKRRLIPLIIEPVVLPAWLYGIVGIDWTKHDPLVDPIEKLKATLGAPGTDQGRSGDGAGTEVGRVR